MLLPNYVQIRVEPVKIPLRWLLVIPFVLQTVGATALVGYLSYRSGQQAVENLANQLLRQTSERVSDRLNSYLQPSQKVVAANNLAIQQKIVNLNNFAQIRQQLWQQIVLDSSLPGSLFWSDQGNALGYERIASKERQQSAQKVAGKLLPIGTIYFTEMNANQRRFYLVDSQGKTQNLVLTIKYNFRTVGWYRQAKTVGKQHWTPIYVGEVVPTLQVMAVAPIYDRAGNFQGMFTSIYFLSEISTFLNQLNFSPTGQVFIIERSGNLIATSNLSDAIGTRLVNGKPERLPAIHSQDKLTQKVAQQLQQKFGSFHQIKNAQQLSLTINNQRVFVQVKTYKDPYSLDWLVITVVPESDFMAQIQRNKRITVLLCLLTLGLAITSGLTIANRFTTRITRLNQVSQQLAAGDLTQRLPDDSSIVEVLGLAQSFNLMADQLEESFDRIKIALEESKEKFTTIFRTSPDPIAIATTREGRFLEVNPRMCEFFGYSREELIGYTATELGLWVNLDQREQFRQLLEQGAVYNFEITTKINSGETKVILLSAEKCNLEQQNVAIFVIKDITDRHQLETMKNEFVSMVSHELRTPLTSIRGSLSILESGVLKNKPDKAEQMLGIAVKSTDRLVRLVNDILNLQRLDSGKVPLVKEICQVNDLIEQAIESVRAIADQANLTLESVPLNASVSASSDEIIQTLINLLGNAIKFSPANSTIWLKAEITNNLDLRITEKFPELTEINPEKYILFSITDQGRGIPKDKLESIFESFQQVNSGDSREKGGTGLGLAICKNIVQRHQGLIWVESVMGQGSTFYFTLPFED
ncbi:ATP-binding protein [Aerosakkonemataceae cyanobacterium BLCC-F154]|uniref:histidine kinase n=1 Tax=Floridaenema fluviatile BLCC-F154 TaxID=3153640 RepID=A0ABV4YI22_9CYAN